MPKDSATADLSGTEQAVAGKSVSNQGQTRSFFASSPANLQHLLARELRSIGCQDVKTAGAGAQFTGNLELAYRACLWSRVANRILMPTLRAPVNSPEQLYEVIQSIDWSEHMEVEQTLAVDFFTASSDITHSQYGALKVKDAVVDQFREKTGIRPSVNREEPDLRINVYLNRNQARVSIDLSGTSLHRRGYRSEDVRAPLKENIAAAMLLACDWPSFAKRGRPFFDPLCGSGTLLIEAAMIASDTAPGIHRNYFGFLGWKKHDAKIWASLKNEATERATAGLQSIPGIAGSDIHLSAVESALKNISQAGFGEQIKVETGDFRKLTDKPIALQSSTGKQAGGLLLCNPPYGKRLQSNNEIGQLYGDIGKQCRRYFSGWKIAMLAPADGFIHRVRLPFSALFDISNGGIDCKLVEAEVPIAQQDSGTAKATRKPQARDTSAVKRGAAALQAAPENNDNNPMFANRLTKNVKAMAKWARKNDIHAYRIYDADMPEYAVAIDLYYCHSEGSPEPTLHVVVQEYQAPSKVDEHKAASRLQTVLRDVPQVLGCLPENVYLKVRQRQRGSAQYLKQDISGNQLLTLESGIKVLVNLQDYLDTGLFLDHRKIRTWLQSAAAGKRFLNLFSYTAVATLHAIAGGARQSLSIDLSTKYSEWAERNFAINEFTDDRHEILKTDVLKWLDSPTSTGTFDLILLDPPTFSNSTDMATDWDVQRDHIKCIERCMSLLSPSGTLVFSTNFRRFRLDEPALADFDVEDRTAWSIDNDFKRNARIHHLWMIRHKT